MKAKVFLPLIAATLFSLSAHAHDCSGGADGGIDGQETNATTLLLSGKSLHPTPRR
jgi:hypothetical protein